METPRRVAKAYVNDLWKGRYNNFTEITSFPSDGYDGIIIERNIQLTSMCSHHHQTIRGVVHIGYVAGNEGRVIGLSKLNRIVEHFGRRGAIQEQLTSAIHQAVETEVSVRKLQQVQEMLQSYTSCMILYTYDSVLFDVNYQEARELLPQIKAVLEQGNFPVKVKVGDIYDKIKTISL